MLTWSLAAVTLICMVLIRNLSVGCCSLFTSITIMWTFALSASLCLLSCGHIGTQWSVLWNYAAGWNHQKRAAATAGKSLRYLSWDVCVCVWGRGTKWVSLVGCSLIMSRCYHWFGERKLGPESVWSEVSFSVTSPGSLQHGECLCADKVHFLFAFQSSVSPSGTSLHHRERFTGRASCLTHLVDSLVWRRVWQTQ